MSDDTRWERLAKGRVVAIEAPEAPPLPEDLGRTPIVVEPDGDAAYSTVLDALDMLVRHRALPAYHSLTQYVAHGPRRELWGSANRGVEHALIETLNDAARRGPRAPPRPDRR